MSEQKKMMMACTWSGSTLRIWILGLCPSYKLMSLVCEDSISWKAAVVLSICRQKSYPSLKILLPRNHFSWLRQDNAGMAWSTLLEPCGKCKKKDVKSTMILLLKSILSFYAAKRASQICCILGFSFMFQMVIWPEIYTLLDCDQYLQAAEQEHNPRAYLWANNCPLQVCSRNPDAGTESLVLDQSADKSDLEIQFPPQIDWLLCTCNSIYRRKSSEANQDRNIYVKHFKNIPMADLEIVLVSSLYVSLSVSLSNSNYMHNHLRLWFTQFQKKEHLRKEKGTEKTEC